MTNKCLVPRFIVLRLFPYYLEYKLVIMCVTCDYTRLAKPAITYITF